MRIIAGEAKGRPIIAPEGQDTRPTQDRVRESLFNILQGDVPGAVVLDLFAGSGALALEALSRGAAEAVLVDIAQSAVVCIERNLAKLGFETQARVLKGDWQTAIGKLTSLGHKFDLVFLDPPYRIVDTAAILHRLAEAGLLAPQARMVVEHRRGAAPQADDRFAGESTRKYGDTEMTFLRYHGTVRENQQGEATGKGEEDA